MQIMRQNCFSVLLARKKQLSDELVRLCVDVIEQTAQFSDQDLL